jgi:hypothetical protein
MCTGAEIRERYLKQKDERDMVLGRNYSDMITEKVGLERELDQNSLWVYLPDDVLHRRRVENAEKVKRKKVIEITLATARFDNPVAWNYAQQIQKDLQDLQLLKEVARAIQQSETSNSEKVNLQGIDLSVVPVHSETLTPETQETKQENVTKVKESMKENNCFATGEDLLIGGGRGKQKKKEKKGARIKILNVAQGFDDYLDHSMLLMKSSAYLGTHLLTPKAQVYAGYVPDLVVYNGVEEYTEYDPFNSFISPFEITVQGQGSLVVDLNEYPPNYIPNVPRGYAFSKSSIIAVRFTMKIKGNTQARCEMGNWDHKYVLLTTQSFSDRMAICHEVKMNNYCSIEMKSLGVRRNEPVFLTVEMDPPVPWEMEMSYLVLHKDASFVKMPKEPWLDIGTIRDISALVAGKLDYKTSLLMSMTSFRNLCWYRNYHGVGDPDVRITDFSTYENSTTRILRKGINMLVEARKCKHEKGREYYDVIAQKWKDSEPDCFLCDILSQPKKERFKLMKRMIDVIAPSSTMISHMEIMSYTAALEGKFHKRMGKEQATYYEEIFFCAVEIMKEIEQFGEVSRFLESVADALEQAMDLEQGSTMDFPMEENWCYTVVEYSSGHIRLEEPWEQLWHHTQDERGNWVNGPPIGPRERTLKHRITRQIVAGDSGYI